MLILLAGVRCWQMPSATPGVSRSATGAALMVDYVAGRVARGQTRLPLLACFANTDMAVQTLSRFEHIHSGGRLPPVGFFVIGKPSKQYPPQAHRTRARAMEQEFGEATYVAGGRTGPPGGAARASGHARR